MSAVKVAERVVATAYGCDRCLPRPPWWVAWPLRFLVLAALASLTVLVAAGGAYLVEVGTP